MSFLCIFPRGDLGPLFELGAAAFPILLKSGPFKISCVHMVCSRFRSAARSTRPLSASTDSFLADLNDNFSDGNASFSGDPYAFDSYSQYSDFGDDGKSLSTSSSYSDLNSLSTPMSRSSSRLSSSSAQSESSKNFKVVMRVRPPLPRELQSPHPGKKFVNIADVTDDGRGIILSENPGVDDMGGLYTKHAFTFDQVYGQNRSQRDVYEQTARDAVLSTLQGYNATIIAYGQTGTGKTYTMEGVHNDEEQRGIIPRSIEEIFRCT